MEALLRTSPVIEKGATVHVAEIYHGQRSDGDKIVYVRSSQRSPMNRPRSLYRLPRATHRAQQLQRVGDSGPCKKRLCSKERCFVQIILSVLSRALSVTEYERCRSDEAVPSLAFWPLCTGFTDKLGLDAADLHWLCQLEGQHGAKHRHRVPSSYVPSTPIRA